MVLQNFAIAKYNFQLYSLQVLPTNLQTGYTPFESLQLHFLQVYLVKSANLLCSGQVTETAFSASLTRPICKFAMLRSSHRNCIFCKSNSSNLQTCYVKVNRINFASCKFKLQLEQSIYHETP